MVAKADILSSHLVFLFLDILFRGLFIMSKETKDIAVVGLGYVGLPLAVCFGLQRKTVGFDVDQQRIQELRQGLDVTKECSSSQLAKAKYLYCTSDVEEIANCQIFIVTVPTPVDKARRPDLSNLKAASKMIGDILKRGDIVIYESTVYPGATEEVCVPELENNSGLKFNKDFFCGYSPERINPGDKENTLTKIKKITSGSTEKCAQEIDNLYNSIIEAGTWKASSIKVAEAAKVIENSQRDLNIAFVNELSVIFERLDIDTIEVLEAAGSKWNFIPFRPGMVGGHCIGIDPYYLTHKAEEVGYNPQVLLAGRRINDNMARYAARNVIRKMLQNGIDVARSMVGVLGVTFKENCPDIRNSKVFDLVTELQSWGVQVVVIDNWASSKEVSEKHGLQLKQLDECPAIDSLIVAVGHTEFRTMSPEKLFNLCRKEHRPVLGDLKSLYDKGECKHAGFSVFRL